MATHPVDDNILRQTLNAEKKYKTKAAAAAALGWPLSTYTHRLLKAHEREELLIASEGSGIIMPDFPSDDIETEEIIDNLERRFEKNLAHQQAKHWFPIKFPDDKPIGLAVVGDPHLGPHCNFPLLRRDVDIMANTDGILAVNIGDTTDNWSNRLMSLWAETDVSRDTERKLARWFLQDAGVQWGLWLMGNHDTMNTEFSTYLEAVNAKKIPMVDWRARVRLVFPSGELRLDAAHNHKGTSIYNRLHGQKRAALWDEDADIYVAGHHHTWAVAVEELDSGRVVTMGRVRGYKWLDNFAVTHGFAQQKYGATILFVINPREDNPASRVMVFPDLKRGAEYLTWIRSLYS